MEAKPGNSSATFDQQLAEARLTGGHKPGAASRASWGGGHDGGPSVGISIGVPMVQAVTQRDLTETLPNGLVRMPAWSF